MLVERPGGSDTAEWRSAERSGGGLGHVAIYGYQDDLTQHDRRIGFGHDYRRDRVLTSRAPVLE